MPDPYSIIFGSILSGTVIWGSVNTLLIEPKKLLITSYNNDIQKVLNLLEKTHDAAISYWSKPGKDMSLEAKVITSRTECYRIVQALNRRTNNEINFDKIVDQLSAYFKIITGANFEQSTKLENIDVIHAADFELRNLRDLLEALNIPINKKTLLFEKIS